MLKRLSGLFGREKKQSATGTLTAMNLIGKAVWTPRNYTALATEGFAKNAIAYRCIRMISEACASIPLRVEFEGRRVADHPLQKLIERPNPEQGGADLREALYGGLQTAGNAYIEAVALDDAPFELWSLRPDRMKVIPNRQGWPEGYEYATSAGKTVIGRDDGGWLKVLHLKLWHPLDDWYGLSPLGDLTISWLRAPRYGGDSWEAEPPLCEDYERYRVQVFDGADVVREVEVAEPVWVYGGAMQAADFPTGFGAVARVEIAQKSQVWGYGPVLSLMLG